MRYFQIIPYIITILELVSFIFYRKHTVKYYLVLSFLSDLSSIVLWTFFSISSQTLWIPFLFLMLFSTESTFFEKHFKKILVALIPILILNFYQSNQFQQLFALLVAFIVFILFIRVFLIKILKENKLNLLYLLLSQSVLMNVLNLAMILINIKQGVTLYYVGDVFQILIYIFLIFMRNKYEFNLKSNSLKNV